MVRRTGPLLLILALPLCAGVTAAQDELPPVMPEAPTYRASLSYEHTRFARDLDPWHLASLELSRRSRGGTIVLRGTSAERFDSRGTQVELDAYPRLAPGVYAYLNVGYSPTELFPEMRYGAELYGSVGNGVEVSAGGRLLDFEEDRVELYTGSIGLYRGNYYFAGRPFVTPKDEGTSLSGSFMARRYLRDADEYLTLRVGGGATPAEELTTAELGRLNSFRVSIDGRRGVAAGLHLRLLAGFEQEELPLDRERSRIMLGAGIERTF